MSVNDLQPPHEAVSMSRMCAYRAPQANTDDEVRAILPAIVRRTQQHSSTEKDIDVIVNYDKTHFGFPFHIRM